MKKHGVLCLSFLLPLLCSASAAADGFDPLSLPSLKAFYADYFDFGSAMNGMELRKADQLPFYAALLEDDTLAAAYLNLGEREPAKALAQEHVVVLRDELVHGILDDMAQIAAGAPLPALGEGQACTWCEARGLCRRDFWSP